MRRPAAPGSQYGARRPEKAVTKYTPPVSGTEDAIRLTSAAVGTRLIESRSLVLDVRDGRKCVYIEAYHLIALPATATTANGQ